VRGWRAVIFFAVLIAVAGAGSGFVPSLATIQCIAYPLIWTQCATLRGKLVGNVALAFSVGAGLLFSDGPDAEALLRAALIQSISLAFSIALGLWITGIARQSAERQRLLDELGSTQERLAAVSREAGAASERERLAREIHDTIAQELTGLVLIAQRVRRELHAADTQGAAEQLDILEDGARHALAETRALVAASAPVGLDDAGIAPALHRLAERFGRETGVSVTVTAEHVPLDRDMEVVLLRCAQESLANVRKHAEAHHVELGLAATVHAVTLRVADDGIGFDTAPTSGGGGHSGFGLSGMRERLALVDGSLEITSTEHGTTLAVSLPRTAVGSVAP
jgi:signal transduction histidine kinase